jgi:hypothetical protein
MEMDRNGGKREQHRGMLGNRKKLYLAISLRKKKSKGLLGPRNA